MRSSSQPSYILLLLSKTAPPPRPPILGIYLVQFTRDSILSCATAWPIIRIIVRSPYSDIPPEHTWTHTRRCTKRQCALWRTHAHTASGSSSVSYITDCQTSIFIKVTSFNERHSLPAAVLVSLAKKNMQSAPGKTYSRTFHQFVAFVQLPSRLFEPQCSNLCQLCPLWFSLKSWAERWLPNAEHWLLANTCNFTLILPQT